MIHSRRRRRGMTLMELVVGLAITGMMAAMGAAAFGSIIDHHKIILRATSEMERASALREQIRSWLIAGQVQLNTGGAPGRGLGRASVNVQSGTISAPQMSGINNGITAAVAAGDEITFTTTAPNPADAPSVRMRLFVDGDASTPETGLTLEYQPSTDTPLRRIQLEPTIGTLTVEYLDQRTNRWLEGTQVAAFTPIALRITMQPYDGGKIQPILQLPIIFPMGTLLVGR